MREIQGGTAPARPLALTERLKRARGGTLCFLRSLLSVRNSSKQKFRIFSAGPLEQPPPHSASFRRTERRAPIGVAAGYRPPT